MTSLQLHLTDFYMLSACFFNVFGPSGPHVSCSHQSKIISVGSKPLTLRFFPRPVLISDAVLKLLIFGCSGHSYSYSP